MYFACKMKSSCRMRGISFRFNIFPCLSWYSVEFLSSLFHIYFSFVFFSNRNENMGKIDPTFIFPRPPTIGKKVQKNGGSKKKIRSNIKKHCIFIIVSCIQFTSRAFPLLHIVHHYCIARVCGLNWAAPCMHGRNRGEYGEVYAASSPKYTNMQTKSVFCLHDCIPNSDFFQICYITMCMYASIVYNAIDLRVSLF